MNGRHLLRQVSAVLLCGALVAGCTSGGDDRPAPTSTKTDGPLPSVAWTAAKKVRDGGTLRLAVEALPANFNPEHTSNSETDVARLLGPTTGSAVRITDDGGWEVDPDYARSVEVVKKKPLTVEVKLNRKAVWQGGTPITARDMIAYVKAHDGSKSAYQVYSTDGFDDIASVEAGDDEYEYTVTFERPTTDWPRYVYPALPANVSKSAKLFNSAFTDRSIPSNGPFRVSEIDRANGRVSMQRNPRWWGKTPRLKKIVWQAAAPDLQLEALAAGELDAVVVPAALHGTAAKTDLGDASLQVAAGTQWTQVTMNGARGPLKDVKVRRAVAAALDRTAIAALASGRVGAEPVVLGSFVLVPGQTGYTDQSSLLPHDLDKARTLLDEAGWTLAEGQTVRRRKGKTLTLTMPVPRSTATSRARARLIVDQLAEVGVQVRLEDVDDAKYFTDRVVPLDFDLATFSWEGSPFPVVETKELFHPIDSGQNFTGTEDDQLGGAWDKGIAALDQKERDRVVRVLDKRLFRDVPIVPLGVVPQVSAVRDVVVNYGASQFRAPDWTQVGFRPSDDD